MGTEQALCRKLGVQLTETNYQLDCSLSKTTCKYNATMSAQCHWLISLLNVNGGMRHAFYR